MNTNVDFLNSIDWNNHDGVNLPMLNDFMRNQFYDNITGKPKSNKDLELPYPDLSQFKIYTNE